jgi:hypothetical protein
LLPCLYCPTASLSSLSNFFTSGSSRAGCRREWCNRIISPGNSLDMFASRSIQSILSSHMFVPISLYYACVIDLKVIKEISKLPDLKVCSSTVLMWMWFRLRFVCAHCHTCKWKSSDRRKWS